MFNEYFSVQALDSLLLGEVSVMEAIIRKSSKQLQELIVINNERFEGYKIAADETQNTELKVLFNSYSLQSKQFSHDLLDLLPEEKYAPKPEEIKISGKLYRIFMDIKILLQGKKLADVLSSCEFEERETQKTYNEILHNHREIKNEALAVIRKQWIELQRAHFKIKIIRYKLFFIA